MKGTGDIWVDLTLVMADETPIFNELVRAHRKAALKRAWDREAGR